MKRIRSPMYEFHFERRFQQVIESTERALKLSPTEYESSHATDLRLHHCYLLFHSHSTS